MSASRSLRSFSPEAIDVSANTTTGQLHHNSKVARREASSARQIQRAGKAWRGFAPRPEMNPSAFTHAGFDWPSAKPDCSHGGGFVERYSPILPVLAWHAPRFAAAGKRLRAYTPHPLTRRYTGPAGRRDSCGIFLAIDGATWVR